MGLIGMWRRWRAREHSARAEAVTSQVNLARSEAERVRLRKESTDNRFADMLRYGIAGGYKQAGGRR